MSKTKKVLIVLMFIVLIIIIKNINKVEASTIYRWPIGGTNSEETYRDYRYYGSNKTGLADDGKYGREYIVNNQKWPNENSYYARSESHFGMDITGINGHKYNVISIVKGKVIATSVNRINNASVYYIDRNQRRTSDGVKDGGGYGNYVVIQETSTGRCFLYAHLKAGTIKVQKGDSVSVGQEIAEMGSSGDSGHMHLHFEIRTSKQNTLNENSYGRHSIVPATNSITYNPEKFIGSAPIKRAKVKSIISKRNGLIENIYIQFDNKISVKSAPTLNMTVGGMNVIPTYKGVKNESILWYQIQYKGSGKVEINSLTGGEVLNKEASYVYAKIKINKKTLEDLPSAAKIEQITSTKQGNNEIIYINFDKSVKVTKTPKLNITIGNEKITATYVKKEDKKLVYKINYDELDIFTSGDIKVKSLTNGKVINNDSTSRNVNLNITETKLGSINAMSIDCSFKGIVKYNKGDINNDGKVNMSDISEIFTLYKKQYNGQNIDKEKVKIADVDMNGRLALKDLNIISSYYKKIYEGKSKEELLKLVDLLEDYDFNNDNKIDITDYNIVYNAWKEAYRNNKYEEKYDFNNDGKVTALDVIFIKNVIKQNGSR